MFNVRRKLVKDLARIVCHVPNYFDHCWLFLKNVEVKKEIRAELKFGELKRT